MVTFIGTAILICQLYPKHSPHQEVEREAAFWEIKQRLLNNSYHGMVKARKESG